MASEILSTYGMSVTYPEYAIRNDRIETDAAAGARIKAALTDLFMADRIEVEVKVYANSGHATRTALLLSDSVGIAAAIFPLSSPLTMLSFAAQRTELWPHLLAIAWQALWVVVIIRLGAARFRSTVLKSGGAAPAPKRPRFGRVSAGSAAAG